MYWIYKHKEQWNVKDGKFIIENFLMSNWLLRQPIGKLVGTFPWVGNRISEWIRLEGNTVVSSGQIPLLSQGHPRTHGTELDPDVFWTSPVEETPQPLWEIFSSAWPTVKFFLMFMWNVLFSRFSCSTISGWLGNTFHTWRTLAAVTLRKFSNTWLFASWGIQYAETCLQHPQSLLPAIAWPVRVKWVIFQIPQELLGLTSLSQASKELPHLALPPLHAPPTPACPPLIIWWSHCPATWAGCYVLKHMSTSDQPQGADGLSTHCCRFFP